MMTICRTDILVKLMANGESETTAALIMEASTLPMKTIDEMLDSGLPLESIEIMKNTRSEFEVAYRLLQETSPEILRELRQQSAMALISASMDASDTQPSATPMESMLCGCILGIAVGRVVADTQTTSD